MQSDDVVWQIINHQFCSFKAKLAEERTFCQNVNNVTGLCLRSACPLANSSYATIREIEGSCYLFIKTAERAHTPKKLWEKIKLPRNYTKALEMVSEHLEHFPKYLVHRNKQRLTKIHQMLIRMRKLQLQARPKTVTTSTKVDRREQIRERKALKAAQLDRAIETELLERLRQVSETEIYNYPEKIFSEALNRGQDEAEPRQHLRRSASGLAPEDETVDEDEPEVEEEEEVDEEDDDVNIEYVEDLDESDDEDEVEDLEDLPVLRAPVGRAKSVSFKDEEEPKRKRGESRVPAPKRQRGPRVEIEYEENDREAARLLH